MKKCIWAFYFFFYSQSIFSQNFEFTDKHEPLTGSLIETTETGFYTVSYNGIITNPGHEGSLLSFHVAYTDPATNAITIAPSTDIDFYNTINSIPEQQSVISGSLIIYVAEGTSVDYVISYASGSENQEGDAMQYSFRIHIEKLQE